MQSFTARMPLLTATSAFVLGRRRWSSARQCYLHCLRTCSLYLLTYLPIINHSFTVFVAHAEAEKDVEHGWIDGVAILAAVKVVVLVSSVNDWQKERQFRSLQSQIDADHTFTVLRAGELVQLPVSELVVGDVCHVKYGKMV